jgi:hypothetical protein
MTFFWDVYDEVNDDAYYDGVALTPSELLDVFLAFVPGTLNRQRDERGAGGAIMDDGPNAWDFYYNALYGAVQTPVSLLNQVYSNCSNTGAWD